MPLEIACFNITSAVAAAMAGADRIELCNNPQEGGTTPSYGTIRQALEHISIPVFPIIRPRGGDFLYDKNEFLSMLYDVQLCKEMGCRGVVLGLLKTDGSIDIAGTTELVQAAGNMEVTFHRAFDRAANPRQALEAIITTGCQRLLTSGQKEIAPDGKELILQLVQQAAGRIVVMPGSGVRSSNILALQAFTGASEFHTSARIVLPSAMEFVAASFQEDCDSVSVDINEVKQMHTLLASL